MYQAKTTALKGHEHNTGPDTKRVLEGKSDTMHFALGHEDANGFVMMMVVVVVVVIECVFSIPRGKILLQVSNKQVEDAYRTKMKPFFSR